MKGRHRERDHDLGPGRLELGHQRGDRGVGRVVGLLGHDLLGRDLVVQALDAVLAELVVLVEEADLLALEVVLHVLAEDLALADVVELPAEGLGQLGRVVPALAARGDEHVRHLLAVQERRYGQVGRRAQAVEDRVDVVLEHQLADHARGHRRVVLVVEVLVDDLAAVDAAVRVEVLEVGVGGGRDLVVARCGDAGQRLVAAEGDGARRDARRGGGELGRAARAGLTGARAGPAGGDEHRDHGQAGHGRERQSSRSACCVHVVVPFSLVSRAGACRRRKLDQTGGSPTTGAAKPNRRRRPPWIPVGKASMTTMSTKP